MVKKVVLKKPKMNGRNIEVDRRPRRRTKPNKRKPRKGGLTKTAARTAKKVPPRKHRTLDHPRGGGETDRLSGKIFRKTKKSRLPRRVKKAKRSHRETRRLFVGDRQPEITGAGHHPGGVEDPDLTALDQPAKDLDGVGSGDPLPDLPPSQPDSRQPELSEPSSGPLDAERPEPDLGSLDHVIEGPAPEQPDVEFVNDGADSSSDFGQES
jgi:hypothetical protein